MATIKTSLMLHDGLTGSVRSMNKAVFILINTMEAAEGVSGNMIDTSALQEARELAAQSAAAFDEMADNIRGADESQKQFNNSLGAASPAADALGNKLKGILATVISIAGIKGVLGWVKENLDLSDTQRNAETQLMAVMKTVGATEEAFNSLKDAAANIQMKGIYGDEIMLGGAAEFATYMNDPKAIESMMGTLANYAMGMSGGGEIDYNTMVDYATQLGKALNGTFDGLKKKGFELSDAQKEIIENGTDMEKALVLDEVISESWDGLYETMSNTPQGKIIQLKNQIGDLREELGDRLYGTVLQVAEIFDTHFEEISAIMNGCADAAAVLVGILGMLAEFAFNAGQAFTNNWSWIEPIIWGLVGAMTAYAAIAAVTAVINGAVATSEAVKAAADTMAAGKTFAYAVQQHGLNAALMACPIFWVVAGVLALIVAIVAVVRKLDVFGAKGTTVLGTIAGLVNIVIQTFKNLGLLVANIAIGMWNALGAACSNIGTAFHNVIANVQGWFYNLLSTVLSVVAGIAAALNSLPFVSFDYSGIVAKADEYAAKSAEAYGSVEEYTSIADAFNAGFNTFDTFTDGWAQDAFDAGAKWGDGVSDTISDTLDGIFDFSTPDFDTSTTWDGIYGNTGNIGTNTGDTAANTAAMRDTLDYMEEDLAYMVDIAEREAINRYTTAEITVEQNNTNYIDSETDVDGIMDAFAADFAEKLDISGEGVD